MLRLFFASFIMLIFATTVVGQQVATRSEPIQSDAFANSLNLRLQTIQLALNEAQNLQSDLELTADQKSLLTELSKDYKQMVVSLNELEKTEGGMQVGLALMTGKLDVFEERLSSDILLPHQSTALRSMVFAKLVKAEGGDLISALSTYYPKQFQLEDSQKAKLKDIKKVARDKIERAKEELEEKIAEIVKETEEQVRSVLKPEQSELLTDLQGQGS